MTDAFSPYEPLDTARREDNAPMRIPFGYVSGYRNEAGTAAGTPIWEFAAGRLRKARVSDGAGEFDGALMLKAPVV